MNLSAIYAENSLFYRSFMNKNLSINSRQCFFAFLSLLLLYYVASCGEGIGRRMALIQEVEHFDKIAFELLKGSK
jgi:hypothetical protein